MFAVVLERPARFVRPKIGLRTKNSLHVLKHRPRPEPGTAVGFTLRTSSRAFSTAPNSSIALLFIQNSSHPFDQLRVIGPNRSAKSCACDGRKNLIGNSLILEHVRHERRHRFRGAQQDTEACPLRAYLPSGRGSVSTKPLPTETPCRRFPADRYTHDRCRQVAPVPAAKAPFPRADC